MNRCVRCGKAIKRMYAVCADCLRRDVMKAEISPLEELTPAVIYDRFDGLLLHFCAMCDADGARVRTDGAAYCDQCWEVWRH